MKFTVFIYKFNKYILNILVNCNGIVINIVKKKMKDQL